MDRVLGLSLVGAGPGNVFGPGMSAGALESFARGGRGKAEGGEAGTRSAAGSGGKTAAEGTSEAEAKAKGVGGQEGHGADANARLHPALDGTFCFEAVAPH
ncbi:hypothetical protein BAE44_0015824 [Dichanthelium oligosanthes]|uniref:Uncharacterized protein n=1 Tax=Dichanthelium oligosanthes TaxID=888268 RepID=A0A1E5VDC6_9POAL|nr:hypothetical protein BAE44_0015824 [Dichanthelium oligosanthes]